MSIVISGTHMLLLKSYNVISCVLDTNEPDYNLFIHDMHIHVFTLYQRTNKCETKM